MNARIEIVSYETGLVDRVIHCDDHKAEKVDSGININLNHDRFYTRVVRFSEAAS